MIGLLCRSLLMALIGIVGLAALRHRSAAYRHVAAVGTLIAMLALPWLGVSLPQRTMPVLPTNLPLPSLVSAPTPVEAAAPASPAPVAHSLPSVTLPQVWAIGAGLLVLRLIIGYSLLVIRVRRARREELPGFVFTDESANVPMTAWVGRHVILLPAEWREWPAERLEHVLRHERAHIERGDWVTALATRLACALYWPNPLAWLLARAARDLAEEAADDRVLVSGVAPSSYATDLLEISRAAKAAAPALALSMAQKAKVARRIEMILNRNKQRGGISLAGLVVGVGLFSGVTIPVATWALSGQRNSHSWAQDVREGKSSPATEDNGYVGELGDGRKVRVVQIAMRRNGQVVAWAPDGTPLPASKIVKHGFAKGAPNARHILLEVVSDAKLADINAGLGSGPSTPGEPSTMTFAGGWTMRGPQPGRAYVISLIEVPKEDGSVASFTFGISDSGYKLASEYGVASGKVQGEGFENPSLTAAKGPFPWDQWDRKPATPAAHFHAKYAAGVVSDQKIIAQLRNGRTEPADGNYGAGYDSASRLDIDYYFKAKPQEIRAIQSLTRGSDHCEILDLHLKPNGLVKP